MRCDGEFLMSPFMHTIWDYLYHYNLNEFLIFKTNVSFSVLTSPGCYIGSPTDPVPSSLLCTALRKVHTPHAGLRTAPLHAILANTAFLLLIVLNALR
jgi:hypothetical protein